MMRRLAPVLLTALALVGLGVAGAGATNLPPLAGLAEAIEPRDRGVVPEGMTVVFVPPAVEGFSDGGDGPVGWTWVLPERLPDGFSDGGDVPEGFIAAMAQSPGEEFWHEGVVPEGLIPVLAWIPPDGFSDGGDLADGFSDGGDLANGFVAVFLRAQEGPALEPGPDPDPGG
jgi:hypothetical protein